MGKSCGFGRIAPGLLLGVAVGLAQCPCIPAGCWAADSFDGLFPFKSGPPGLRLKPLVSMGSGVLSPGLASPRTFPTGCVGQRQHREGQSGLMTPTRVSSLLLVGGDTANSPAETCVGGRGARSGLRKIEEALTKDLKLRTEEQVGT